MEDILANKDRQSSEEEISKVWLDCLYWSFKWRFEDFAIGDCFSSERRSLGRLGIFFLSIQKISKEAFCVEVHCETPDPLDKFYEGCAIKFYLFMPGCSKIVKNALHFNVRQVPFEFKYSNIRSALNSNDIWTVKCVIKMSERTVLVNDERNKYNKLVEELIAMVPDKERLLELESLLGSPLNNLFTGRETEMFVSQKIAYIKRTIKFVHVISGKIRKDQMRRSNHEQSHIQKVYLGNVYSEDVKSVNKEQVIKLYLDAHYYGLQYLVRECIDFMLRNIDDEYLVSILMASDMVFDLKLECHAFSIFNGNRERIMRTNSWKILKNEHYPVMQSILSTARLWILGLVHHQLQLKNLKLYNLKQAITSNTVLQRLLDYEKREVDNKNEASSMEEKIYGEHSCRKKEFETFYYIDECSFDAF